MTPRTIPIATPLDTPRFSAPPPLTLYVHIPWCVRKCPYCDFNSHEARGEIPETDYLDALLRDLESALPEIWGRKVHAVFFGGGTPSLLSAAGLDRLLTQFRTLLPLDPMAEITLEANPGTVEAGKFRDFRTAGVNRISLGIQSFNDRHLLALGRIHNADEAKRAIDLALTHVDNVNLDLMYALPGQSLQEAIADVETARHLGTPHLSAYHLTIEPNTLFHAHPPTLPDDDTSADMQIEIESRLTAAGYTHYETSAFARKHHECLHNLNYWYFGDYLGIGAGAHSKLTGKDRISRSLRHKQPKAYMTAALSGHAVQTQHDIAVNELGLEFMMNALRLRAGFAPTLFQQRTGLPLSAVESGLRMAEQRGLIERSDEAIYPTAQGRRFLNELLQLFMPCR